MVDAAPPRIIAPPPLASALLRLKLLSADVGAAALEDVQATAVAAVELE